MLRKEFCRPRPRRRLSAIMAVLIFLAGLLTYGVNVNIRPALLSVMEYQCHSLSVKAVQNTVLELLEEEPQLFEKLYRSEYDSDGNINLIRADSTAINRMKLTLCQAVEAKLLNQESETYRIPLGTLLGLSILAEVGPSFSMQILQESYVVADVTTRLETTGVNQTEFTVLVDFSVTMSATIGGDALPITTHHQIPVVQMVIMGKVPQYYSNN